MQNVSRFIYLVVRRSILCICIFQYFSGGIAHALEKSTANSSCLTKDELAWVASHPIIRLAADSEYKPIEFFDEKGVYSGIGADYAELISKHLGIKFEIVKSANWNDVISKVKRRDVDVLNAVISTPEREEYLNFSTPYLTIPSVIIVNKNVDRELKLSDLAGMNVVMVSGYGYVDLLRSKYPKIKIVLVSDLKIALRKVSFGIADAFVGDLATASFYIESEGITNLTIAGESQPSNISGFAVRSDWPELISILNKGISSLTEEERRSIQQKWIHLETAPTVMSRYLTKILLIIAIVVLFVVCVFWFWNRTLKSLVHVRTEELRKEIEDRKAVEKELKESKEQFKAVVETSPLAIYISEGLEQKAIYINSTFKKFFGYGIDEVPTAEQWYPLAYPDVNYRKMLVDEWEEKVAIAVETNSEIEPLEANVTCKDGSIKTISWGFISLGKQNWAFGLDLTDRKKAEDKKEALEGQIRQFHKMEAIGTLAGGIAHDFNNILAVIIGYAEIAQMDSEADSKMRNYIAQIIDAGYRAKSLTKQILAFSRQAEMVFIPVQPAIIAQEAVKMLRSSLPSTININLNISKDVGAVLGDPTQIHQILTNLCANAFHAMETSGGTLSITLDNEKINSSELVSESNVYPGYFVRMIVSDTGMGIAADVKKRIFDPYFTTKESGKGTGMGLAIIHGIVTNYGGFITCHSQLNEGSTFCVYLPFITDDNLPEIEEISDDYIYTGNEQILFIDDEKNLAEMGQRMLEKLGYHVTAMTSSLEALKLFRSKQNHFDLIITDQTMPDLVGSEFAYQIMKIRPDIPIILCTGFTNLISKEEAIAMGIKAFAMKPIAMKDMAEMVRDVLDRE